MQHGPTNLKALPPCPLPPCHTNRASAALTLQRTPAPRLTVAFPSSSSSSNAGHAFFLLLCFAPPRRIVELSTCHLWDVSGNKEYVARALRRLSIGSAWVSGGIALCAARNARKADLRAVQTRAVELAVSLASLPSAVMPTAGQPLAATPTGSSWFSTRTTRGKSTSWSSGVCAQRSPCCL